MDAVLTSVDGGGASTLEAILPRISRRGALVAVGAPNSPLPVNIRWLMANDITLRGSLWFERRQIEEMLRLAISGHLKLPAFEAEVYELSRIDQAMSAARMRSNPLRHVAISCT